MCELSLFQPGHESIALSSGCSVVGVIIVSIRQPHVAMEGIA